MYKLIFVLLDKTWYLLEIADKNLRKVWRCRVPKRRQKEKDRPKGGLLRDLRYFAVDEDGLSVGLLAVVRQGMRGKKRLQPVSIQLFQRDGLLGIIEIVGDGVVGVAEKEGGMGLIFRPDDPAAGLLGQLQNGAYQIRG